MTTTQTGFKQDTLGSYIEKDPAAELTYVLDWSVWMPAGDGLATATWSVATVAGSSNVTVSTTGIAGQTAYAKLAGGTAGTTYTVTNTITTTNGLTDRRRFRLRVVERYA